MQGYQRSPLSGVEELMLGAREHFCSDDDHLPQEALNWTKQACGQQHRYPTRHTRTPTRGM